MKNPNSPLAHLKRKLITRWSDEDYPGGSPRFQISLFGKDIAVFFLLPVISIVLFKSCENIGSNKKPRAVSSNKQGTQRVEGSKSQILDFRSGNGRGGSNSYSGIQKRAPGTLVRVRLLNSVETYSNAPVHAQILDESLGKQFVGGTLIGDAISDTNYQKINITFRYLRDPNRAGFAVPVAARALSFEGTLGLDGIKKEGFFARATLNGAASSTQKLRQNENDGIDLKQIIIRALSAGLIQEFGADATVEKNRAQVLTLQPPVEFYAELTDFFPGVGR